MSGIGECSGDQLFDSNVDVGIGADDAGCVATEFQGDSFEGKNFFEHPADFRGAGEREHFDALILGGFLGENTGAVENVDYSGRTSGFVDNSGKEEGAECASAGGLDDDGVASGESGGNLVGGKVVRPVVGDDCEDWSNGDTCGSAVDSFTA